MAASVEAIYCPLCPDAAHFSKLNRGQNPNNTHYLMEYFVHFHFPGRSGTPSIFRPSARGYVPAHPVLKNCRPDAMRQKTGPSFTSFYDGGAVMACERRGRRVGATLMRKRQTSRGGSVEIGAPVFITLLYRLNSRRPPLPLSAKCPLDLLSVRLHLKQLLKNE